LFRLSFDLHSQPSGFFGAEQVGGQALELGCTKESRVLALAVSLDVLGLEPERRSAILVLVDGEGDADHACFYVAKVIFQDASELYQLRHSSCRLSAVGGLSHRHCCGPKQQAERGNGYKVVLHDHSYGHSMSPLG